MWTAFWEGWAQTEAAGVLLAAGRAVFILVAGLLIARAAGRLVRRFGHRLTAQHRMVLGRALVYSIALLTVLSVLREAGFDLSVLLGAAGILTVAVGFASQTSMSNVISGLFLIGERPFVIGDVIRVGDVTGEVVEVGLVSVHIRTFENLRVRIPNEQLFKSQITNLSQYPIRRIDIVIRIGLGQDLPGLQAALTAAAEHITIVLDEPKPSVLLRGFSETGVELLYSVWAARENVQSAQNAIHEAVHGVLVDRGVRLPVTRQVVEMASPETATPNQRSAS